MDEISTDLCEDVFLVMGFYAYTISVQQLPQLEGSCLLDRTPDSLQTKPPATLFFYFHSLSSLCAHTLTWPEIFFLLYIYLCQKVHMQGVMHFKFNWK